MVPGPTLKRRVRRFGKTLYSGLLVCTIFSPMTNARRGRTVTGVTRSVGLGQKASSGCVASRSVQRDQAGSMVASSTSRIGMSSRTGYTRRHSAHFRLSPLFFCTSGFLQTGQTRISSSSLDTMSQLYDERAGYFGELRERSGDSSKMDCCVR